MTTELVTEQWELTPDGLRLVEALQTRVPRTMAGIAYLEAVYGRGGAFQQPKQAPAVFLAKNPAYAARLWEDMQPYIDHAPDELKKEARQLAAKLDELAEVVNRRNSGFGRVYR